MILYSYDFFCILAGKYWVCSGFQPWRSCVHTALFCAAVYGPKWLGMEESREDTKFLTDHLTSELWSKSEVDLAIQLHTTTLQILLFVLHRACEIRAVSSDALLQKNGLYF